MDLSQLVGLGKVAGIGGIVLGVLVALLRPVIEQSASLPESARGWLLTTVSIGAFVIAALGLVVWRLGSRPGAQIAQSVGDDSRAHNIDRTRGSNGRQDARARGDRSPAINERGR